MWGDSLQRGGAFKRFQKINSLHNWNDASVGGSWMNHISERRNAEPTAALFTFLHVKCIHHSAEEVHAGPV